MIIVFIICAILYLIMMYGVISLYYTYRKEIVELENRLLQLEKRTSYQEKIDDIISNLEKNQSEFEKFINFVTEKEKEAMACKGKRKK